jgi:polyhydroxyalkanoate synthesis regulator protein
LRAVFAGGRNVAVEDLADMILAGERFLVRDAETGADITRDVLDRLHQNANIARLGSFP